MSRITLLLKTAILTLFAALTGCNTFLPGPTPVLPTQTYCAWIRNPGPVPQDILTRAQKAFSATGLAGKMNLSADGEYYCEQFNAESIYFEFTITVSDLGDPMAVQTIALQVEALARNSLQGANFGGTRILFKTETEQCSWDEAQNSCGSITPLPKPD